LEALLIVKPKTLQIMHLICHFKLFPTRQIRLAMKLTVFLLFSAFLQVSAAGYSQTVNFSGKEVPLKKIFAVIKKQTGYVCFYDADLLKEAQPVTVNLKNAHLEEALSEVLKGQPFTWLIENKTITIVEKQKDQKLPGQTNIAAEPPRKIQGTARDANGKPLAGVSVIVKGTQSGTSTNASGEYSLMVENDRNVLVFSMVGFGRQTVEVKGRSIIDVVMEVEVVAQDEVAVIGYGTAKKKDLTGAVSSVSGEDLAKMPNAMFDAALAGKAPGVQVVKSSGAPGAVASIRIRGGTSAIGTNEPLYVIDGIPIEMGDGFGNAAYQNDSRYKLPALAGINPEDIESIDILKDASSGAIYGSRAANGVVMVTTKRGKKSGKPIINFDYNSTFDQFANYRYNMLSADEYHQVVKDAYQNAGTSLPDNYLAYPYAKANTNWVDLTTRTAVSNNLYLNIRGGSKDGSSLYSFSGGLTNQDGVIRFTDFQRKNLRSSLETTLFGKLHFGTNLNFSMTDNGGNGVGQFYSVMKYRPDVPLYDSSGRYGASPDSVTSNPYARISQISDIANQGTMVSFFGELEIIKGLKFRSTISSNLNKGANVRYTPSTDVFEIKNGRRGSRDDYAYSSASTIFDNTLTFDRQINRHALNVLGGMSFTRMTNNFTSISSVNFQDDYVLNNLGSAGSIQTYNSGGSVSGLSSYFLRSNYNFGGKYYATFTGRADHSTKFGPDNRWGFFPSGALAWKIVRERFMQHLSFFDDLKLRVSYGKTGSANFSDFQYATFFGSGSFYNGNNGVIANTIPNPDIRWESTYQLDAAIEFGLFKNRLYGSIGYFHKTTKDMILNRQIIRETGGSNQYANMGDFLNRGWELVIGSEWLRGKDFSFTTDLNITQYRSKVLKLNNGSYLNLKEGQPIGYFTGYRVAGIFQQQGEIDKLNAGSPSGYYQSKNTKPGDFKFVDVNGDGFIGQDDNIVLGKAEPDFYGGWNNVLKYKNLECTAFFTFSVGNSLYNSAKRDLLFFTSNSSNYSKELLNAWSGTKTTATLPRNVVSDPNNNRRDSEFFIEKGSFFKLKNFQVSYLLKGSLLNRVFINSIKAYASISNVFIVTKYSGLDPEVNAAPSGNFSQGIDNNTYPQTRTITLGLNVNL
jgi:TonB-linked SusC/RagA family outer membrane protein